MKDDTIKAIAAVALGIVIVVFGCLTQLGGARRPTRVPGVRRGRHGLLRRLGADMRVSAEAIEPQRPNIVQEILTRQLDAINNRVWDEIEEFLPPQYRGPQWPRYGVWFEMDEMERYDD